MPSAYRTHEPCIPTIQIWSLPLYKGGLIEGAEETGGGAPSEGHVAAGGAEKEAVETRLLFVDGCREEAAGGCCGVFAGIVAGKQRAAQVGVAAQPA